MNEADENCLLIQHLVYKSRKKRPFQRLRRRWEDDIKMYYLRKIGREGWIG
jgi:hypothetical protein